MALPTLQKEDTRLYFDFDKNQKIHFTIKSVLITSSITIIFYLLPNYLWLEMITTQGSDALLSIFGFNPRMFVYEDAVSSLTKFDQFMYFLYDGDRATYPAISVDIENGRRFNYLIVRACTGMQAGALLLGLIWSTPAKLQDRIRASYAMLLALFIGNVLRIAAMIAISIIFFENFGLDYETSWSYAHDVLGRPLGFFGTIGFTILIERRGVRILDTITVWIDTLTGK